MEISPCLFLDLQNARFMYVVKQNLSCTFVLQLHHLILVRATRVNMEELVFLRALASCALVQMTTLEEDVNNVCMFKHICKEDKNLMYLHGHIILSDASSFFIALFVSLIQ